MFTGNKETQCSNCAHLAVCSFKSTFLEALKAAENISVSTDKNGGIICVRDVGWLKITVNCEYYVANVATRRSKSSQSILIKNKGD